MNGGAAGGFFSLSGITGSLSLLSASILSQTAAKAMTVWRRRHLTSPGSSTDASSYLGIH